MNFLITSGGTKAPIDLVRDITNQSHGNFASKLALEALKHKNDVTFMYAKGSKTPFSINANLHQIDLSYVVSDLASINNLRLNHDGHYSELEYTTYADYSETLKARLTFYSKPFDVIMLAAAVSDYLPKKYYNKKVKSSEELTIELKKAEKLIGKIKKWQPETFLVGFKMLVNASNDELLDAAQASIKKNKCNMVIANDYEKIKAGNPEVFIVHEDGDEYYYSKSDGYNIPEIVMNIIMEKTKK